MKSPFPLLALQRQRPGTFALLIAATCLLMLLAAALALSLRAAAHAVADMTAERLLVQVVDADPARREDGAAEVETRLAHMPGVAAWQRVPERDAYALVAPYISGMRPADLPLPILFEVRAHDGAAVAAALKTVPAVQVTAAGAELGPLRRLIEALRVIALGVALTAAAATALIAMLSARAALARESGTLEILHALGATDRQVSRLVAGKIARDAGLGAALGLAAAIAVILLIAARVAAIGGGVDARLGVGSWTVLVLLALGLVGLAILAAQAALLATWRRAP